MKTGAERNRVTTHALANETFVAKHNDTEFGIGVAEKKRSYSLYLNKEEATKLYNTLASFVNPTTTATA